LKERPYHHGNLQIELLEEGLKLIHEEGRAGFSLRKLVKRIGVSPTACYNHYPTVDALLAEMKDYITRKFSDVLCEAAEMGPIEAATINMGRAYVVFFAENPHYFSFIYDTEDCNIILTEAKFDSEFEPFCIFKENAIKSMEGNHIAESEYHDNLIIMWAAVHGLAAMANMKGFQYSGDWGTLTEKIIFKKLVLS
jgi:AcrR family transcriptional regulator